MRADQLLVERGLAATRSQAQRLIASGVQWHGPAEPSQGHRVGKNGQDLPLDAHLTLLDSAEARYVSRGGLKLEGALRASGVSVEGCIALDVGQSTGGFTDCLLQLGAKQVVGVDVGQGQLHPRLRSDPRVQCVEQLNARALKADDLSAAGAPTGPFDLVVADVSFISLTLVLPALVPLLKNSGAMLLLVKPQFELQAGQLGKGGVVRDTSFYPVVRERLFSACQAQGLKVQHWLDSPIAGGDGNREFFVVATRVVALAETP